MSWMVTTQKALSMSSSLACLFEKSFFFFFFSEVIKDLDKRSSSGIIQVNPKGHHMSLQDKHTEEKTPNQRGGCGYVTVGLPNCLMYFD